MRTARNADAVAMRQRGLDPRRARLMRLAGVSSVAVALTLIGLKLWGWAASGSVAVLSSLADSLLDLAASSITLLAVRFALMPADREHRFGHGKSESIAGLIQALIISGSALYVGVVAVERLLAPEPLLAPRAALGTIAVSLVLTSALFALQRYVIARTGSLAISADSVHYQADILTHLAVLAGLWASYRFGLYVIDPLLGLIVVVLILWSVRSIALTSVNVLLDRELPAPAQRRIEAAAACHPAVLGVHDIRTRSAGSAQFIQLHVEVDPNLSVLQGHAVAEEVEREVRRSFPLAEVLIHVDPFGLPEPRDRF